MQRWRDHSGHGDGLHARLSAIRINLVMAVALAMALMVFLPATIAAAGGQSSGSGGPAASVDPIIGTGKGPGGNQNLFPGAAMPFGMVQLSPDTESRGYGYHYYQPDIQGFSMTHMSGPGCTN